MSRLVVFTFDTSGEAARVRSALRDIEKRKTLTLDDAVVLVKDSAGNLQIQRDRNSAVIIGAVVGGFMGLLLMFMFPIIGIIFGAAAGALVGRLLADAKVGKEAIADVQAALRPGSSALLAMLRGGDIVSIMSELHTPGVHVYQTTLSRDTEARLREELQ
jgi:uncharacterized membrane protein